MINLFYILLFSLSVSFQSIAGNWNQSSGQKYFNDFSKSIYKNWADWNTTGPYPKAAKIKDGKLIITVTDKMLDTHTNRTGRFEIEKKNISKSLAVYQKFRVRSHPDNLINDRVLISQIKQYDSGGSSQPQATVFLDRAPTCAIYSYKKEFKDFPTFRKEQYLSNYKKYQINEPVFWRAHKKKSWFFAEFRKTEPANKEWKTLNDGKWHTVEMDVYPHSKKGYCIIKIDGKVYISLKNAPTRSLGGGNFRYDARIGIYRDTVKHSHTVEYDDWEIETYKPETGLRIGRDN
jgi:hypothetical protein